MKILRYSFKKSQLNSWDQVFKLSTEISLKTFQTGSVTINRRGTINPNHPRIKSLSDEKIEVPILAYLVHHPQKGYYLLDAGLDRSFYHDPHGKLQGLEDEFHQKKNENIAYHLRGIKLEIIFLSHLHADHAAGIRELPKDVPCVISKEEYSEYNPEVHGDYIKERDTLYEIDFNRATKMPILGASVDLLGDCSLWAIHTPGHTSGHMSFLINMETPILLTMDAAFISENLEKGVSSSEYTQDVKRAQESLEKIIEFMKEYPQVIVCAGHERLN